MAQDLTRLRATLLTSGIQQKNSALFQVIDGLIANLRELEQLIEASGGSGGGGSSIVNITQIQQFIDAFSDSGGDDYQGMIAVGGGGSTPTPEDDFIWVPLTDGDALEPSDIFDSFGNHIMVQEFFP